VGDTLSVVDYIKNMNKNLNAGKQEFNVIPDTQAQIAEYLFLFSVSGRPQELDEVVDFDYKTGLVTAIIQTDHTRDLKVIIDAVNNYIDTNFADSGVNINLSGSGNNSYIWGKLLIDSQTNAIMLSKVGILIIASLILMSFVGGIFVVLPVTVSTLIVAGVAGFFKIPLDVSTALAAGIAIGVGVDYAVHYIFRYRLERQKGVAHEEATANTLRTTGRTIVLNALVVTAGFAVLFASQFPPHVKLGYFVAAYMFVSCIIAVFILPALFAIFKPKFVEPHS
jgi:predicted RND superfamily exporter protein